jgi:hypothetical protein
MVVCLLFVVVVSFFVAAQYNILAWKKKDDSGADG